MLAATGTAAVQRDPRAPYPHLCMKRRNFLGGVLATLGALAWGKLPAPEPAFIPFAEGTFLHLDGDALELGLIRDSVLNAQNDFLIFGESFMLDGKRVPPYMVVTTASE